MANYSGVSLTKAVFTRLHCGSYLTRQSAWPAGVLVLMVPVLVHHVRNSTLLIFYISFAFSFLISSIGNATYISGDRGDGCI